MPIIFDRLTGPDKADKSSTEVIVGKYYKKAEWGCACDICWEEDFCDTGILGEECLKCNYLVRNALKGFA